MLLAFFWGLNRLWSQSLYFQVFTPTAWTLVIDIFWQTAHQSLSSYTIKDWATSSSALNILEFECLFYRTSAFPLSLYWFIKNVRISFYKKSKPEVVMCAYDPSRTVAKSEEPTMVLAGDGWWVGGAVNKDDQMWIRGEKGFPPESIRKSSMFWVLRARDRELVAEPETETVLITQG